MSDTASSPPESTQEGGKRSAWMTHVKKTMKAHKGMKLGQVLKLASKTFKKSKRGGGVLTPAGVSGSAMEGGRRRRRGSTRRSRKH